MTFAILLSPCGEVRENCIKEDAVNFVEIKIVFEGYQRALALWTNEDNSVGQRKVLVKRQVFQKVRKFFGTNEGRRRFLKSDQEEQLVRSITFADNASSRRPVII